MKTNNKVLILLLITIIVGGCTNITETFTSTYTDNQRVNFNVKEETQLFAVGDATVNESGSAVAKMKAKESAKEQLKKQIFSESTLVLNSLFQEIQSKSISTSKTTIEDLAGLVASNLISEASQTNTWANEGKEFVVLAIDKNVIPDTSKDVFIQHLETIIVKLKGTIEKVSNDYKNSDFTQSVKNNEESFDEENTTIPSISDESNFNGESSNSEPEVFLDDF